jgi:hypothetical protein
MTSPKGSGQSIGNSKAAARRLRIGIGRLIGLPSMIGDGAPPALLSNPFLLNTTFITLRTAL